uniref:Glycosyltransferase n=1 Tax=Caldilinea aerophila TaxID=133453 RepID=A0A7C1FRH5_9CHLR
MNPRVCFVAPFGLGQKTTVWARTLPLARVLATHGWRPTLLIPPWDTPQDDGRRWKDGEVELINIALRGGLLAQLKRLLYEINSIQPDIVHIVKPRAHAGLVQWWLWRTPRQQRPPILLDADDWEQAWAPINRYPWPLARFLAWQEEWGIRHADGVTVASRWLAETIGKANPTAPLLWLPNGVEPPAPDAPRWRAHAGKDILFFTRFVEVSPQWLTQFISSLYEKFPDSALLIAGAPVREGLDRPFRRLLQESAHPASVRIEWVGFIDHAQLANLYNRIGCAVFPAEPTLLQQAKCSVRLANTLLAGVPVVASAVGEQAIYGADGAARLVPAQATPEEFAATVAEVLATPAQQRALSKTACQRLLTRYDWRVLGAQLHAFYQRILEN